MLTKMQYETLLKFRRKPIRQVGLNEIENDLWVAKLIEPTDYIFEHGGMTASEWSITKRGLSALEEYEQREKGKRNEKLFQIALVFLAAILAYFFGLLDNILEVLRGFFQSH